ncbi:MAG: glycosyltransferase family 2 protein [Actinobacteria bacterium]|nr:glycosyltransferase family 2 protein [Actinomycetota bacterium]
MKLVLTLMPRDEADIVDAQIAYHLNAGVDFVIATDNESQDGTTEILRSYERDGHLHLIRECGEVQESGWRTRMARLAATDFGADWVIDSDVREFWWPRAESLKDVLVAIPGRYTVVQALVRHFVPRPDDGRPFAERMTARRSLRPAADEAREPLESALRPVFRADSRINVGPRGIASGGRRVPLRAWYPIEVLRFHIESAERTNLEGIVGDDALARALDDGALVVDTRLRDALRTLRISSPKEAGAPARQFSLPDDGKSRLVLRPPDVVDDAAYAVECAELGEVDITVLERQVQDLERRLAELESGFSQRLRRKLSRIAGRLGRRSR